MTTARVELSPPAEIDLPNSGHVHVSALMYCTTMTTRPSGLSVTVYQMVKSSDGRWRRRPLGVGLPREMGRQASGLVLQAGGKLPFGRRSEGVAAVPQVRPRFQLGTGGTGHSLIPHAAASSSRVKTRPCPASDRIRFSASRSPASRRRRRFSARSASNSVRGPGPCHRRVQACELLTTIRAVRSLGLLTVRCLDRHQIFASGRRKSYSSRALSPPSKHR